LPQPRKPSAHHALTGNLRPDRHRQLQADPAGIGDPPAHLPSELAALWVELRVDLYPGVARRSDRAAYELCVRLTHRMREDSASAAHLSTLRALYNDFGMTPGGRQRLDVALPTAPKKSDFDFRS
jgi:hypothetical protein